MGYAFVRTILFRVRYVYAQTPNDSSGQPPPPTERERAVLFGLLYVSIYFRAYYGNFTCTHTPRFSSGTAV